MSNEQTIEEQIARVIDKALDDWQGEEDFTEIGFGISGAWTDPAQCGHILLSDMQNYSWEVENGMPDPEDIKADVEIRRRP